MDPQETRAPSLPFAPVLWIAVSTPLIFLSLLGAGYGHVIVNGSVVSGSITIICLPGLCLSLVQYFLLRPARPPLWRWILASTIGTAMGLVMAWVAILGLATLLDNFSPDLTFASDNLAAAILGGGSCGMFGGLVTGIFASLGQWIALRLDRQMTGAWMGANIASWGVGLAAICAFVFGLVSQLSLSF